MVLTYPYGSVAAVRKEAGDPDPEDVTDLEIEEEIDSAGELIELETQRTWDSTMKGWFLVKRIVKYIASAFVMDKYDDPKGEMDKNFTKGMLLLEKLTHIDTGMGDVNIAVTEYQTYPKNPHAVTSRGRLSPNPIVEVAVDPDDIYEQEF